jgi:DNA-directed RNA polymerase subunit omega
LVPPSLKDLMKISDSKYAIVVAVAKRARALSEGKRKDEDWRLSSMVTTALEELNEGKVKITYKKRTSANE